MLILTSAILKPMNHSVANPQTSESVHVVSAGYLRHHFVLSSSRTIRLFRSFIVPTSDPKHI